MAIKETPTNFRVYYKSMRTKYTALKEETLVVIDKLTQDIESLHEKIQTSLEFVEKEFGVNLNDYSEFVTNKYTTGSFLKVAKGLYINKKQNHLLVADLFDIYVLAKRQKEIYDLTNKVRLYDKMLCLSVFEYREILNIFYTTVQKKMILEGYGYVFEGDLGWICINRCKIHRGKPVLDYALTRKRREELKAQGKRVFNKEEAEWCKKAGIEYNAEDPRVYRNDEYCYQIPLINCNIPNGRKFKFTPADSRGSSVRGLTNEDLKEQCNYDKEQICELPIDLKTKLTICTELDKTLYTNFIRNENQEALNFTSFNRKDRQ